jgi:ribosomal protein S8
MAVTDPIADFLTRIRNAQMAGHSIVEIPASNMKKRLTEILYDQGYILKYKFEDVEGQAGLIKIALKYDPQRTCDSFACARFSPRFASLLQIRRDSSCNQWFGYCDSFNIERRYH